MKLSLAKLLVGLLVGTSAITAGMATLKIIGEKNQPTVSADASSDPRTTAVPQKISGGSETSGTQQSLNLPLDGSATAVSSTNKASRAASTSIRRVGSDDREDNYGESEGLGDD